MTNVATRRRHRLDLIVASLCAVTIVVVVVVVVVVARRAFAKSSTSSPVVPPPSSSLSSYPVAPSPIVLSPSSSTLLPVAPSPSSSSSSLVAISIDVVACRAVARCHLRSRRCQSPSLSSSYPVAPSPIAPSRRRHRHCHPLRRRHHRLRINTGTPHFSLGIPILVWGSPNQNGDPQTEMGMQITKNPQTDSRIPKPIRGPIPKRGSQNRFGDLFSH